MEVTRKALIESGVVQQVQRYRNDEGESVCGIFRCDFEPLQRRVALHIPIHPPFKSVPSVEAIGVDCDLRARVTDCQKFGVRLEIVVNDVAASEQSQFVDIVISAPTEQVNSPNV